MVRWDECDPKSIVGSPVALPQAGLSLGRGPAGSTQRLRCRGAAALCAVWESSGSGLVAYKRPPWRAHAPQDEVRRARLS